MPTPLPTAIRPKLRMTLAPRCAAVACAVTLAIATPALAADPAPAAKTKPDSTEAPIVTHHQISIAGKALAYTVTTGKLPLKNETGETEAEIPPLRNVRDLAALYG